MRCAKGQKPFAKKVTLEGAGPAWLRAVKKATPLARKVGLENSLLAEVMFVAAGVGIF